MKDTTTIQISNKTKALLGSFGKKEDSYEEIIKRLYGMAVKEQLREFLMSSDNCVPVEEALERARKKWRK